jgi:hypothetical protein
LIVLLLNFNISFSFICLILGLFFLHDGMLCLLIFYQCCNLISGLFWHRSILSSSLDSSIGLINLVFDLLMCLFNIFLLLLFSFCNIFCLGSCISDLLLFFKILLIVNLLLSLFLCFLNVHLFSECFFTINIKFIFFFNSFWFLVSSLCKLSKLSL